jgi:glycosyltransferase involved in cell wall biosynthesis
LPRSTRLVVRYFDAIPVTLPETVRHRRLHRAMHLNALYRNAADGAWFACASDATRADLLALLPEVESRSFTIPCMLSHAFHPVQADPGRIAALLGRPPGVPTPYLLMVSTLEPRKNHLALIEAWERLRSQGHAGLHLVLVGNLGWQYQAVLKRMQPGLHDGGLHHLSGLDVADLRLLYRHASLTVAPSLGEGFDFAGVESMRCGGIVAASDIPVHRGVYADAAVYFPARDPAALARTVHDLLEPSAQPERERLRATGARVAARYLPQAVQPQWLHWLERVAA